MHANGDGTATCCHCARTERIPAGVTPEATYRPDACGPYWTPDKAEAQRIARLADLEPFPEAADYERAYPMPGPTEAELDAQYQAWCARHHDDATVEARRTV